MGNNLKFIIFFNNCVFLLLATIYFSYIRSMPPESLIYTMQNCVL